MSKSNFKFHCTSVNIPTEVYDWYKQNYPAFLSHIVRCFLLCGMKDERIIKHVLFGEYELIDKE